MEYKSSFVGEMIAFSIYNKSFKPLGIRSGQVKSHGGLIEMIPTNIVSTILLKRMKLHTNNDSYS